MAFSGPEPSTVLQEAANAGSLWPSAHLPDTEAGSLHLLGVQLSLFHQTTLG